MIRKITLSLIIAFISLSNVAFAQEEKEEAVRINVPMEMISTEGNPVLIMLTASWCVPCHYMRNVIFKIPSVSEVLKKYNIVLLDVDSPIGADFQRKLKTDGTVPYFFILDSQGRLIDSQRGGTDDENEFIRFLKKGIPEEGEVEDAMKEETMRKITGEDFEAAKTAVTDAFEPHWNAAVTFGGGICWMSRVEGKPDFNYFVTLSGRRNSYRTIFEAGLMYSPLCGIAVPLDLHFKITRDFTLGAGMAPSFILPKGEHRNLGEDVELKKFDIALRANAAYRIGMFRIGLNYSLGLINQYKGSMFNATYSNMLNLYVAVDIQRPEKR